MVVLIADRLFPGYLRNEPKASYVVTSATSTLKRTGASFTKCLRFKLKVLLRHKSMLMLFHITILAYTYFST